MLTKQTYSFTQWCIIALVIILDTNAKKRNIVLTWESLESCKGFENKFTDLSSIRMFPSDESTISLRGSFDVKAELKGPIPIKLEIEKMVGLSSYMPILLHDIPDVCRDLTNNSTVGRYSSMFIPKLSKCPMTKQSYDVSKVRTGAQVTLTREMVGKYRIKISASNPQLGQFACYLLDLSVDVV